MIRRSFNILLIAVLALNLMGAWAFASSLDCGMECCEISDTAKAGIPTIESPGCCQTAGVTCGFETGQYKEFFNDVLCCYTGVQKVSDGWDLAVSSPLFSPSTAPLFPTSESYTGPPPNTPLYIHNLTLIC